MMDKLLPPAHLDPRNPSYEFKKTNMEHIENSELFKSYLKEKEFKKIFTGTLWGEGPVYIPHKETLIWSDIPNNRMMKLFNGKVSEYRNPSNYCNGNTIDNEENLISCSHGGRCVYKTDQNDNTSILIDKFNGKKLNSPNDICVKSDGTIWFTDPPYGILSDYEGYKAKQEYGGSYVFCYDPYKKTIKVILDDLDRPNGIAFSQDEKKLYVADTGENIKHLYVYDIIDDELKNKKLVYDFKPFFSDGFRSDKDGNIWTSAGKGIKCFDPNNKLIGQILLPELVSNLEFGGKDFNILYVTATTSLYSIELNQVGAKYK